MHENIFYVEKSNSIYYFFTEPHQWLSISALELVDGSCWVQSSVALVDLAVKEFSEVFFKTRVNMG